MAAKRHVPTKAQRKQIERALGLIFDGEAQFVTRDQYTEWYGRIDEEALRQFTSAWNDYCDEYHKNDWVSLPKPKLLVGTVNQPKGWILIRNDKHREWLEAI